MIEPLADKQATGILLVLASTIAFAIGPTAAKLALDNGSNTLTVIRHVARRDRGRVDGAPRPDVPPGLRHGFQKALTRFAMMKMQAAVEEGQDHPTPPVLASVQPLVDDRFRVDHASGFHGRDIELLRMVTDQFSVALERMRLAARLRDSETRYRGAVITGRIAAWETDMVRRRRVWTEEGMALFGLDLPNGIGQVGGENDEFHRSLHPDDRHMMAEFHRTADQRDSYPCEYRIVRPDGSMLWVSGRGRVIARDAGGRAERVATSWSTSPSARMPRSMSSC